jgi:hypothetical protein
MAGTTTHGIVAKIWSLCNVLEDAGVTTDRWIAAR